MNPVPDDVLLPCHWLREEVSDDGMEFRRDDDRFVISAVRNERRPPPPDPAADRAWELRCHQRVGEASSVTTLGYVTTREATLDTVLEHMERINETIEGEVDLPPGAMIDLLAERTPTDGPDDRTRTTKRTAEELSP